MEEVHFVVFYTVYNENRAAHLVDPIDVRKYVAQAKYT